MGFIMKDQVFISYAEEDSAVASDIAAGLEGAGYVTWYFERDGGIPGVSYLEETCLEIEESKAFLLLISEHSVKSNQVTVEIERAHESDKPIIPLRIDIEHDEALKNQPVWKQAIGTKISIPIPSEGVEAILPRLIVGLEKQGLKSNPAVNVSLSEPIKDHTQEVQTQRPASSHSSPQRNATSLTPYYVNRTSQDRALFDRIARHKDEDSRRPLLFFLYGRKDQAADAYIDRVQADLPKKLQEHGYDEAFDPYILQWAFAADVYTNKDSTLRQQRQDIKSKLNIDFPTGLAQAVKGKGASLFICYRLEWKSWTDPHLEILIDWARSLAQMPDLPLRHLAIVCFAIEYKPIKPNFIQRALRKTSSNHPIHSQLERLQKQTDSRELAVHVLPELSNVTDILDIEMWIDHKWKPDDPLDMRQRAKDMLAGPIEEGMSMKDLIRHLKELIEKG
jgi:hypothetical protein